MRKLTALLAFCAPALAQDEEKGQLVVTRQDVYERFALVEHQLEQGSLLEAIDERSALARTSDEYDQIWSRFLAGFLPTAARELAEMERELDPNGGMQPRSDSGFRADVRIDGRWVRSGEAPLYDLDRLEVRVRSMWMRPELAGQSLVVTGRWIDASDSASFVEQMHPYLGQVRFDERGRAMPATFEVPVSAEEHASLNLALRDEYASAAYVRAVDLDEEFDARIAALDRDDGAARAFRSRASLNVRAPSMERSAEFLHRTPSFAGDLAEELAALEKGDDPYRSYPGQLWRTFAHGEKDLAAMVHLPPSAPEASIPLVVCLHDAGVDEGFYFTFGGHGRALQLAERHGCLLVTPFTPSLAAQPEAFDALLAGIAEDYPIDPDRVFVFGHSLGAVVTAQLCTARPERIAGACCVSGFSCVGEDSPPVMVIQGERDVLMPAARVRANVASCDSSEVTYYELEDLGHTLLIPYALDRAFADWFGQ